MQSFSSVLRRYYPKVFLSNLLGLFTIYLIGVIIVFLVGIFTLAPLIQSGLLNQLMNMREFDPTLLSKVWGSLGSFIVIIGLVLLSFAIFFAAGIVGSSVVAVCHGRPSVGSFFSQGFRFFFRMLGLSVLMGIAFIPAVILFIVFFVSAVSGKAGMAVTFLLLTAIVGAIIYMMFMFAPYMMIADNEKVLRSMSQSFRLFRSRFGYVFVTGLGVFGVMLVQWIMTKTIEKGLGPDSNIGLFLGFLLDTVLYTFSNLFIAHRYQNRLRGELYPGGGPTPDANWKGQGQGHQAHGYSESPQSQGPATGFGNPNLNPQGQTWQQPSPSPQPPTGSQSVSWSQPNQTATGKQSGTWEQPNQSSTSSGSGAQSGWSQQQQPSSGPQFQSPFQPSFTFNPVQQQGKPAWQVPQSSQPQSAQPSEQPQPEKPTQQPRYPRQQ
jgi:hypothetical protein